ncbi:hypothetical protein BHE74_00024791 [Ensete ventricosum]|nr:hypothetical protein BHE74_00024791 [Ensete ventricosum]
MVSSGEKMEHGWVEEALGSNLAGWRLTRDFIVGAIGHSYFLTPFMILVVRYAFCLLQLWRVDLTHVRSTVQSLTPPCLCQVGSPVPGRSCWRSSHPRMRGRDSHVNICHIRKRK